jgi:hypothetical protein
MPKKLTTPPPLDLLIKKHILLLNNELPPTEASIWVTSKELHQRLRLIHTGVRKSLRKWSKILFDEIIII